MKRENFSSGGPWEEKAGYSRAVKVGNSIFVAGTTSVDNEGNVLGDDAYSQTKRIIQNVAFVLREAGAGLNNIVRTRIFTTNIANSNDIMKAHHEYFNEIKPAATLVEVSNLIDSKILVEIEFDAVI